MIISDLEHLEVVSEETNVEGGYAYADALASAYANGRYYASTFTNTYSSASSYGYYYYGSSYASSGSTSSSAAS